jgi:hypothetical protein
MREEGEPAARRPALMVVVGAAIAAASIPLVAAAGPPYLSFERLSPWLVTYAIGLFGALFATPFALHRRIGGALEADSRWERALLGWGVVAAGALVVGLLCGLPSGFSSDSAAGSLALVTVFEAVLVLGTLAVWLVSG